MIDGWLSQLAEIIGNNVWIAPILALLAGILTSITPCSLSNVPLIIGYVGGVGERNLCIQQYSRLEQQLLLLHLV